MSIVIQDAGVAAALESAIGHTGPYSDAELAQVRELRIVGAGALDELAHCTGLERLVIIGADVSDLGGVRALHRLRTLHVLACPVTSAEALVGLDRLEELRLDFAFLEDAAPLFALPSLRRARLLGNPWSEASWKQFQQHALPPPGGATAARPIFDLGAESKTILSATRRFRMFGLALCSAALDPFRVVMVRPGKARVAGLECDWAPTSHTGGWLRAKESWTTDTLFEATRSQHTASGAGAVFDFESHRELGDREDALRWIDGEHDPARRTNLQRFIERFPGTVFFRDDDAFHAMAERRGGISLPTSYRDARKILAGAFPGAPYRVEPVSGDAALAVISKENAIWYGALFEDYASEEGATIRDVARLYPFARCSDESTLAISLDGDQPDIREYRDELIFFELERGNPAESAAHRVYSSYAELLGHIAAFKLPGDVVVEASATPRA